MDAIVNLVAIGAAALAVAWLVNLIIEWVDNMTTRKWNHRWLLRQRRRDDR